MTFKVLEILLKVQFSYLLIEYELNTHKYWKKPRYIRLFGNITYIVFFSGGCFFLSVCLKLKNYDKFYLLFITNWIIGDFINRWYEINITNYLKDVFSYQNVARSILHLVVYFWRFFLFLIRNRQNNKSVFYFCNLEKYCRFSSFFI